MEQYAYSVKDLNVTLQDVVAYITGGKGDLPDVFLSSVNRIFDKISSLETLMGYEVHDVEIALNRFVVDKIEFEIGDEVDILLKNSKKIAVFACTTGMGFENKFAEFSDIEETYILDIIGTLLVEKLTSKVLYLLQNKVNYKKFKMTNTISPGNCGWSIGEQEKLFQLLPDGFLGISLNSSGMMYPVKSISGVVGIGENVTFNHSDCEKCTSKNCLYRKNK